MKYKDITQMTFEERKNKAQEIRTELMKLRAQVATGTNPQNSDRIKQIKKTLAKIKTAGRNAK